MPSMAPQLVRRAGSQCDNGHERREESSSRPRDGEKQPLDRGSPGRVYGATSRARARQNEGARARVVTIAFYSSTCYNRRRSGGASRRVAPRRVPFPLGRSRSRSRRTKKSSPSPSRRRRPPSSSNVRPPARPHLVIVPAPLALRPGEHVPKPQRLVPRARDDRLPVGRYRQVQHPKRVPRERREFRHRRIPPHDDLILRVPVRGHELVDVLTPHEVTHLRPGVHARQRRVRGRVPKPNASIRGPPPRREQAVLRVVPYKANVGVELKGVRSGVERRRGRGLKARDPGRTDTPGKVLKERRSPRERGRMGTSVILERA